MYYGSVWVDDDDDMWDDEWIKKEQKKEFDRQHNIKRDSKGRLNKGALLAKKDSCNELEIIERHISGMTVKAIARQRGCSKSTVYNAVNRYKKDPGRYEAQLQEMRRKKQDIDSLLDFN